MFCPFCGCVLFSQKNASTVVFTCRICPVGFPIRRKIIQRTHYQSKTVDAVLGGAEAWKNADQTRETCPECSHPFAYFYQVQIRSADEPMTNFYRCVSCAHNWRD